MPINSELGIILSRIESKVPDAEPKSQMVLIANVLGKKERINSAILCKRLLATVQEEEE